MTETIEGVEGRRHLTRSLASDFSFKRFGFRTFPQVSRPIVGLTKIRVLVNNPDRIYWLLINHGANIIYLSPDESLTTSDGVPIAANGGSVRQDIQGHGSAVSVQLNAISTVAGQQLYIYEIIGKR